MKTTLITGASSGIGEVFARKLAAQKHNLFLVARSEEKLRHLCTVLEKEYAINAKYLALDLTARDAPEKLYETTEKEGCAIDMLINNAGVGSVGDFARMDIPHELDLVLLNIHAVVAITRYYLPGMRKRNKGTVINVSSMAGFQSLPFMATYSASKTFVRYFSEAIAAENKPFNIFVMTLCPGATETNFFEASKINKKQKKVIAITQKQSPEDVVEAALKGLRKRRRLVVPGLKNRFFSGFSRLLPNSFIAATLAKRFHGYFR